MQPTTLEKLRSKILHFNENHSHLDVDLRKGTSVPFLFAIKIVQCYTLYPMFKDNKYTKCYTLLTDRAKNRVLTEYRERHHVAPRSLGGSNKKENLVWLTAREHFICHWLLIKMTEGEARSKMVYALQGMKASNKYQDRYNTKITARVYAKYREEHAKNHSTRMKGKKAWNKGRKLEGEELAKHRERTMNRQIDPVKQALGQRKRLAKLKGYKHSEETKLKQSLAAKGKSKGPMSEEEKLKRSIKQKGIAKTESHADNIRKANLGNVSINKDGIEKKIKRDTLDQYLLEGWQLGGRKRKSKSPAILVLGS